MAPPSKWFVVLYFRSGQIPSAKTNASDKAAPRTTASNMILAFTGLSFRVDCQNSPAG